MTHAELITEGRSLMGEGKFYESLDYFDRVIQDADYNEHYDEDYGVAAYYKAVVYFSSYKNVYKALYWFEEAKKWGCGNEKMIRKCKDQIKSPISVSV